MFSIGLGTLWLVKRPLPEAMVSVAPSPILRYEPLPLLDPSLKSPFGVHVTFLSVTVAAVCSTLSTYTALVAPATAAS